MVICMSGFIQRTMSESVHFGEGRSPYMLPIGMEYFNARKAGVGAKYNVYESQAAPSGTNSSLITETSI